MTTLAEPAPEEQARVATRAADAPGLPITPSSAAVPARFVATSGTKFRCVAIIPALNEEKQIGKVVADLIAAAPGFDVLVIDDGSTDRTAQVAASAGASVVRHPFNMGYGVALQTAYKYAVRRGYDLLVQLDGDGQHDPGYVVKLAEEVLSGRCDVCVGSRFKEGGSYVPPFLRRAGMVLFGYIASVATRRRVTDPTSGYQALTRRAFTFFQTDLFPFDYPDADVLILLHRAGFRVDEIAVKMRPSPTGKSMHSGIVKPLFYVFKMFLSIAVTLLREAPRADRIVPGER